MKKITRKQVDVLKKLSKIAIDEMVEDLYSRGVRYENLEITAFDYMREIDQNIGKIVFNKILSSQHYKRIFKNKN